MRPLKEKQSRQTSQSDCHNHSGRERIRPRKCGRGGAASSPKVYKGQGHRGILGSGEAGEAAGRKS